MTRTLKALWKRLRGIVRPGKADDEFVSELDSHLAMHIEDSVRAGMTPE